MKKILFFLLFTNIIAIKTNAQDSTFKKANAIYVEGLGLGIVGSINYDKVFAKTKKWQISYRVGTDPIIIKNIPLIVELNFFKGFGKSHLEVGVGSLNALAERNIINNISSKSSYFLGIAPHVGYRYQTSKPNGHTFFKVFLIPMYYYPTETREDPTYKNFGFIFFGGLSYGVSF